jgi:Leucine-rich repeat (LRR) protein
LSGSSSMVSTLPTELGMLTNLVSMKITGTKFYGRIPPELFQLPNLSVIHLSNNHFTGTIPPMRLPSVKELLISRNDLTGSIPGDLTALARLENFEAYHNKLTGRLPSRIGDCSSLKRIGTSGPVGQSALFAVCTARI